MRGSPIASDVFGLVFVICGYVLGWDMILGMGLGALLSGIIREVGKRRRSRSVEK
jgi:hypothetical protein